MKIKFNKRLVSKFLFDMLLVSTLVSYIGYYLYSKKNNINVYKLYSDYVYYFKGMGVWVDVVRFLKDILIVVLFIWSTMLIKNKKQIYFVVYSMFFYFFGIFIAIVNGYNAGTIISGIRSYLYPIFLTIFFSVIDDESLSVDSILTIITFGCLANLVIVVEQAVRGTNGNLLLSGQGNYRFPGLFGGVNGLSGFAIAASIFVFIVDYKIKLNRVYVLFIYTVSLVFSILGGARSGIINILIVFYIWVINATDFKYKQKVLLTALISILAIPAIILFSSNLAGRGNILQVQLESGRLNILANILKNSSLFQLVFGRGIGVGSNSSVTLNQLIGTGEGRILDGTFNVILYQYGLIGIVIFAFIFLLLFKKMNKVNNLLLKLLLIGTILLQCLTGNIFETFAFLVLIFAGFQLLTGEKISCPSEKHKKKSYAK